jgi:hypothetical protein
MIFVKNTNYEAHICCWLHSSIVVSCCWLVVSTIDLLCAVTESKDLWRKQTRKDRPVKLCTPYKSTHFTLLSRVIVTKHFTNRPFTRRRVLMSTIRLSTDTGQEWTAKAGKCIRGKSWLIYLHRKPFYRLTSESSLMLAYKNTLKCTLYLTGIIWHMTEKLETKTMT